MYCNSETGEAWISEDRYPDEDKDDYWYEGDEDCPYCEGEGNINGDVCLDCDGTGVR